MLPQELGCGSGMTCWRRLRDWQQAGIWDLVHFALLDWLARQDQIDWSRAVVDSCSVRAMHGGTQTGPNPTDRAKRGSKRHLICDGQGVPLAVRLTGANRNDSQEALALVDAIPPLQGERGRRRCRPVCVVGERYDAAAIRHGSRAGSHPALAGNAPLHARQWSWAVAVGRRADVRLAESISTSARPVRQTGRLPRGISLARLRVDLLAVAAQGLDDGLNAHVRSPYQLRPDTCRSRPRMTLPAGTRLGRYEIGRHCATFEE